MRYKLDYERGCEDEKSGSKTYGNERAFDEGYRIQTGV